MSKRRILIIEPDEELSSVVVKFLGKADFEVAVASDGLAGIETAGEFSPHLILVDLKLDNQPEGGLSLGKSIKSDVHLSKIPLVLMLPEGFDEEKPQKMKEIEKIFDGLLYKPFADTELKRVVENFTGFGESPEIRKKTLEKLLKEKTLTEDPDLKNLVEDLKEREPAKPSEEKKRKKKADISVAELEEQLAQKEKIIREREKRIANLLEQLSDLEMDHSFALEALETEKAELADKLEKAQGRIAELEEKLKKTAELLQKALNNIKAEINE